MNLRRRRRRGNGGNAADQSLDLPDEALGIERFHHHVVIMGGLGLVAVEVLEGSG